MVDCRRVNLSGGEFGVDIQEEDVCIRVLSCKGLEPRWIQRLEAYAHSTTGETVEATRCACAILGHLHEMNTPDLDKLAMLRALKDKDERVKMFVQQLHERLFGELQ